MWAMVQVNSKGEGIVLGSWWTTPDDEIDAVFSLYRTPNEVLWKVKEPTIYNAKNLNYDDVVKFVCFRKNTRQPSRDNVSYDILEMIKAKEYVIVEMDLAVMSKNWFQGRRRKDDALEIRLIPNSKSILKNNTNTFFYGGLKKNARYKLLEIFNQMEKGTNNQLSIESDPTTQAVEYRNFIGLNNPLDTIDKIALDNMLEYFYANNVLYIGKMVSNNTGDQSVPNYHVYEDDDEYVNTSFTYKFNYKGDQPTDISTEIEVLSGGYPNILPLPGTEIIIFGKGKRVIYNNITFSKKYGGYSTYVAVEKISIPRNLLYDLLPRKAKEIMGTEMKYNYPNVIYGDIQKYVLFNNNTEETIRRNVNLNLKYTRHDPENMDFEKVNTSPVMYESSPYAGDEVGVQYPKNINGKVIALAPDGKYENATIIGQLHQENKIPKRDNIEDYRLTLPNGGTMYYDSSQKMWITCVKGRNIIGIQSDIDSDTVPLSSNMESYIQIGKSTGDGADYIYIKTPTNEITLDDTKIELSDGTRKITMDGSTVNVT